MPYTAVQTMQLLHGVEAPWNSTSNLNRNVQVPAKYWEHVVNRFREVVGEATTGKSGLYLHDLTILRKDGPKTLKLNGAVLVYVEGFEPALSRGNAHPHPYWPTKDKHNPLDYVPYLDVHATRLMSPTTDDYDGSLTVYRHLTIGGGSGVDVDYNSPNATPGDLGKWRGDLPEDWSQEAGASTSVAEMLQGDVIFAAGPELVLEVDGAFAATIWIVGFGKPADGASLLNPGDASGAISNRVFDANDDEAADVRSAYQNLVDQMAKGDVPQTLYLVRRPVVSPAVDGEDEQPFAITPEKPIEGVALAVVEDFAAVEPGGTPTLILAGDDSQVGRTILYRQDSKAGTQPDVKWTILRSGSVSLARGDLFLVVNSKVALTVVDAGLAYIRIAGFGPARADSCGGRPC